MSSKMETMTFAKIYPLLCAKAMRKGRTQKEVDAVIQWLTGYDEPALQQAIRQQISYAEFFRQAPMLSRQLWQVSGTVCGVRVETIEDPLMRPIRVLDKLIDDLAKGKPLDTILMKEEGK